MAIKCEIMKVGCHCTGKNGLARLAGPAGLSGKELCSGDDNLKVVFPAGSIGI
jgi:hypothetical protein